MSLVIAFGFVFVVLAVARYRTLDRWWQKAGRAPIGHLTKLRQREEEDKAMIDMPSELRRRIRLVDRGLAVVGIGFLVFMAAEMRRK
jgi:hypothetical protein